MLLSSNSYKDLNIPSQRADFATLQPTLTMLFNFEVLLVLGAVCYMVESSHFRGGIIMVRPQPGGVANEVGVCDQIMFGSH